MIVDPIIVGSIAWAVVFGAASAWLAHRRDRIVLAWAFFGAILGPVGLVLLWAAPPGRCASCRAPVRGWITECEWCGMDVRGRNAGERSASRPLISVAPTLRPAIDRTQPIAGPAPQRAKAPKAAKAAKTSAAAASGASASKGAAAVTATPAPHASSDAEANGAGPATSGRRSSSAAAVADAAVVPVRRDQQVITSGVYVTGTVGLSAGSRYTITHDGVDLQVLGPSDRSPKKVAYERPLEGVDATAPEDRLILTAAGGRGGTVLVFMSVEGDPSRIAGDLTLAARSPGKAGAAT